MWSFVLLLARIQHLIQCKI